MAYHLITILHKDLLCIVEGFNVNFNPTKHTLLNLAKSDNLSGLKYLFCSKTIDFEEICDDIYNNNIKDIEHALLEASSTGRLKTVMYIVKQCAESFFLDDEYYIDDCLEAACKNGHLRVVMFFIKHITRVGYYFEVEDLLAVACENNHFDIIKYLVIEEGADVNYACVTETPLVVACQRGCLDLVIFLVEHGADIHARRERALRMASQKNHLSVFKFLLRKGANLRANRNKASIVAPMIEGGVYDYLDYIGPYYDEMSDTEGSFDSMDDD